MGKKSQNTEYRSQETEAFRVVPFKFEHFQSMELDRPHQTFFLDFPGHREMLLRAEQQPAWTAWYEGRVIACGGIVPFWKGVGEGWFFASPEIAKHKVALVKSVKGLLWDMEEGGYHRIQAVVLESSRPGRRLVEYLGFKFESILKKYGPGGENFIMYGRVS
jgi:RimJ/RimL family protein N-acetyltransferase